MANWNSLLQRRRKRISKPRRKVFHRLLFETDYWTARVLAQCDCVTVLKPMDLLSRVTARLLHAVYFTGVGTVLNAGVYTWAERSNWSDIHSHFVDWVKSSEVANIFLRKIVPLTHSAVCDIYSKYLPKTIGKCMTHNYASVLNFCNVGMKHHMKWITSVTAKHLWCKITRSPRMLTSNVLELQIHYQIWYTTNLTFICYSLSLVVAYAHCLVGEVQVTCSVV